MPVNGSTQVLPLFSGGSPSYPLTDEIPEAGSIPMPKAALLRLGVAEGPALGGWLRRLRRARYDGTLGDAAAARRLVRRELEETS